MIAAAYDCFENIAVRHRMNASRRRAFRDWGVPFRDDVAGRIAAIDGDIFHLWHGRLIDRQQRQRHEILSRFDFDPAADIALDPSDLWRWSSNKPGMHDMIRAFFLARAEDG